MPSYKLIRSENPNDVYLIDGMPEKLPGTTHNPRTFLLWLYQALSTGSAALWLGLRDGKICGYAVVLAPNPMNNYAFMLHAYAELDTPTNMTLEAYALAEEWARERGAAGITAITARDELRAFERRYGFKVAGTYLKKEFDPGGDDE